MEDECSVEELTAFLDASDGEDDTDSKNTEETETNTNDEIGDEEIQAFLEASDDDADEESDEDNECPPAAESTVATDCSSQEDQTDELAFDDLDEADFEELDQMLDCENGQETQTSTKSHVRTKEVTGSVNMNQSSSSSTADQQDDVKSEMAAMAERIKQLEAMLAQNGKTEPEPTHTTMAAAVVPARTSQSEKRIHDEKNKEKRDKRIASTSGPIKQKQASYTEDEEDNPFFTTTPEPRKTKVPSKNTPQSSKTTIPGKNTPQSSKTTIPGKNTPQSNKTTAENTPQWRKTTMPAEYSPQSRTTTVPAESTVDAKSLFGDSDDSDWDELDGGEKTKLSEEGRELKKLMKSGPQKRVAHTASYDPDVLKKPNLKNWNVSETKSPRSFLPGAPKPREPEKPALNPETGTVSGKYKLREEYMPRPTVLQKEDERESVTDPYCGIRIINPRISMVEFKNKMAGRSMIKIPRLLAKMGVAELQKDNWVTVGVVVHKTEPRQSANGKTYCIWKLSDLQDCDKTVTFFLFGNVYKDHWKNDLGVVVGLLNPALMDKAEKAQSEVAFTINHPGQMLVLGISKDLGRCRGTTKAGQPCSAFINKMKGEYCTYHVQAAYRRSSSKRTELQASTGVEPKAFQQKRQNNNKGFFFYGGNTFSTMKPQAQSSKDKMNLGKLQTFESRKAVGKVTTMSLHELEPKEKARLAKLEEKDKNLLELLSVPTAGSMNFVKHLVKNKDKVATASTDKPIMESVSALDLLKQHKEELRQKQVAARRPSPLQATPTLGKGFSLGQDISLDVTVKKAKGTAAAELAKQLAIQKVRSKGGIEKEDPNAVRKTLTSPEAKAKIKKRVAEDMEPDDRSPSHNRQTSQPPKKRSKFLGDLDLNSPEVQSLLKSKSKHTGALAEAEAEHEERYFSSLEQKERMEDKMAGIMEVPVTLVVCLKCKYKTFSLGDLCKKENHPFKRTKGVKRFFRCKQCKRRTVSIERIHTTPCKDCGSSNFERVSMLKERKGPKLESEELCIRGNEEKFVGSVQGKSFLNV